MEGKPDYTNRITKARRFSYWITKKLGRSNEIDGNHKRSYENIYSNRPSKKLDQKKYKPFRVSKDISKEVFQLELPEGWMIHNVFNEDLLT